MPAALTGEIRKPSASAVSRTLSHCEALGITRAPHAGAVGFTVKNVAKEQEQHGGPVTVRWSQPDREPDTARLIAHGRQTLIRTVLEESGYAVTVHPRGYLVLLHPDDVAAHRKAEQAAGALLGDGGQFWREESGTLLDDAPVTAVARTFAVAEVALALRTGRAPYEEHGTVFIDGDVTVTFTTVTDDEVGEARPESPLQEAQRIFRQMGETVLDLQEAKTGTGVWVRASLVPGEVLVQRKDDGMTASGVTALARDWETIMEFYRRLLEDAGWSMTGRGNMGWSFYRTTPDDAVTRAERVLRALWPEHEAGERSGWSLFEAGSVGWVSWCSELPNKERRSVAEVAMLPYLADALRRVGLATTMPDECPGQDAGLAPIVTFAEPSTSTLPRYRAVKSSGSWWVADVTTSRMRRRAASEEAADRMADADNRTERTNRRLGRVSNRLPGMTRELAEVPEYRVVAAQLAAAGYMPANRWESPARPHDGFLMGLSDGPGIEISHLSTDPEGGVRITRPVDEHQAEVFDAMLLAYVDVLSTIPPAIVTLKADHVQVFGAAKQRRRPQVPAGQLFDAAVTYRVDHGAPRTSVFRLSARSVDPYGFGEVLRHPVAVAVAAGRDVDRIVIDDVHPFEAIGTRRHRAQTEAAEMLVRVLGEGAVWRVEVDWLWSAHPEVQRTPEEEDVVLLSVPDNAPAESIAHARDAAEERGWSAAKLSRCVAWVQVPVGGDAMA
ncbi:hypothetical protein [Streptomyces rochei]|uniref:hypothetical protein n=1 Tax=Streptomyces rochei TaxID=1928 RepID=UPI0036FBA194